MCTFQTLSAVNLSLLNSYRLYYTIIYLGTALLLNIEQKKRLSALLSQIRLVASYVQCDY
jgi:hypothetical protein